MKAANEISTLYADYVTSDNIQLFKGQHVQVLHRTNNEFVAVQLINNSMLDNTSVSGTSSSQYSKKIIEVQLPISLIRTRNKLNTDGKFYIIIIFISSSNINA